MFLKTMLNAMILTSSLITPNANPQQETILNSNFQKINNENEINLWQKVQNYFNNNDKQDFIFIQAFIS